MENIKEFLLEDSKKDMNVIDGKMTIYSCYAFSDLKFNTEDELIEHMMNEWNRCKQYLTTTSSFHCSYPDVKFEWPCFSPDEDTSKEYINYMNDGIYQFKKNNTSRVGALNVIILKFIDFIKRVSTYSFKMHIYLQFISLILLNCTFEEIKLMSANRINYYPY